MGNLERANLECKLLALMLKVVEDHIGVAMDLLLSACKKDPP